MHNKKEKEIKTLILTSTYSINNKKSSSSELSVCSDLRFQRRLSLPVCLYS